MNNHRILIKQILIQQDWVGSEIQPLGSTRAAVCRPYFRIILYSSWCLRICPLKVAFLYIGSRMSWKTNHGCCCLLSQALEKTLSSLYSAQEPLKTAQPTSPDTSHSIPRILMHQYNKPHLRCVFLHKPSQVFIIVFPVCSWVFFFHVFISCFCNRSSLR